MDWAAAVPLVIGIGAAIWYMNTILIDKKNLEIENKRLQEKIDELKEWIRDSKK